MKLSDHSRSRRDLLIWLTFVASILVVVISVFVRMIIEAVGAGL